MSLKKIDEDYEAQLDRVKLFIYLIPILGVIPALWTLSRSQSTSEEKQVSRVAINLAIAWITAYCLLLFGANYSGGEVSSFRLLYTNSILTSAYFVTCSVMLFNLWRGKLPRLPFILPKNRRNKKQK